MSWACMVSAKVPKSLCNLLPLRRGVPYVRENLAELLVIISLSLEEHIGALHSLPKLCYNRAIIQSEAKSDTRNGFYVKKYVSTVIDSWCSFFFEGQPIAHKKCTRSKMNPDALTPTLGGSTIHHDAVEVSTIQGNVSIPDSISQLTDPSTTPIATVQTEPRADAER